MSSKTLVIGASGQIGQLLLTKMQQQGLACRAIIRKQSDAEILEKLGAEIMMGDLEKHISTEWFEGCNQVIFTAGSGGHTGADKTILVDLWAACLVIDKALETKIQHFVMVSARDAGQPEQGSSVIKHYNVCKHFADKHLIDSGLPYTILRPGRLTNDIESGLICTERPVDKEAQIISRGDVAQCLLETVKTPHVVNRILELYQGDIPISEVFQS